MVGDGRLMPDPDYPCKVINVKNGFTRENRSWIIGRMLRDCEPMLDRESLLVEVFVARKYGGREGRLKPGECERGRSYWIGLCTIAVQLGVAAIPFGLYEDWGVFIITVAGTVLALITGWLHQWRAEKLACRENSDKTIAITKGNGSRYVMVIFGCRRGLDLEDLAAGEGPRMKRPWEKYGYFKETITIPPPPAKPNTTASNNEHSQEVVVNGAAPQDEVIDDSDMSEPKIESTTAQKRAKRMQPKTVIKVHTFRKLPVDFWLTRSICLSLTIAWTALLIAAAALDENAWYLLAVGAIGMAQNAIAAGVRRSPEKRGIHLKKIHVEGNRGGKVMDVLMDIESAYPGKNIGRSLVKEFFPGQLEPAEIQWWNGDVDAYDKARTEDEELDRGVPWRLREEEEKIAAQGVGRYEAARKFERKRLEALREAKRKEKR